MQGTAHSTFDPASVLETAYTDDLNTRLTPIPEGEFLAQVKSIAVRQATSKDGQPLLFADFVFTALDEEVKKATGLKEPQVRYSIMLDVNPGTTTLRTKSDDPNANVRLGRLKEACGIKPGRKWTMREFEGLTCMIKVKQRTGDDGEIYSDVSAVRRA